MTQFSLSDRDWDKKISDVHADKISRLYCEKWRSLYPYLKLDKIVVADTERNYGAEGERRKCFITNWRKTKGSKATYKVLVYALLTIDQRLDAENICRLLAVDKTSVPTATNISKDAISPGTLLHSYLQCTLIP